MKTINNLTGYAYIDEVLTEIKKTLPKEKQTDFEKVCKNLYLAGITEGLKRQKKLN